MTVGADAHRDRTPHFVHGMGKSPALADWPPLTADEISNVLRRFDVAVSTRGVTEDLIAWRSPRPMSAAGLVRSLGGQVFVKRHHVSVRSAAQLRTEHGFAHYLRSRGQSLPAVRHDARGATVVRLGDYLYEVHEAMRGVDLYRDVPSWHPFANLGHARQAGVALARFHRSAVGYSLPARPPGVLTSSSAIVAAEDPEGAVAQLLAARPGLARALSVRPFERDLARLLLPAARRAGPFLRALPRQWGHGDWHPSNLVWSSTGGSATVSGVFDLGLADCTSLIHDLAVAIERTAIDWLDLAEGGDIEADLDVVGALLGGYEDEHPLNRFELAALHAVLPVAHLEYALSEVEYFADVLHSPAGATLAYEGYLVGHAQWFGSREGSLLLDHVRRRRPGR